MQIINNNEYNKLILDHYSRLAGENPDVDFSSNIENLENCNKFWVMDHYREQKIKDFKRTNLCKDKFCNNCKLVKQASRLAKFIPLIEDIAKDKYIWDPVFYASSEMDPEMP